MVAGQELSSWAVFRLGQAMLFQRSKMANAGLWEVGPFDMSGKNVFVTGTTGGIGYEIAVKLVEWGANVVMGCRREDAAKETCENIKQKLNKPQARLSYVALDLMDLESVMRCAEELQRRGEKFDVVDLNAGLSPTKYELSKQGFETAFATNCLGNLYLIHQFVEKDLMCGDARVLFTGGDIYITQNECTPDYKFSPVFGFVSYARSKLGLMWIAREFHRRYPKYLTLILHPGVFDSGLVKVESSIGRYVKQSFTLDNFHGAQLSLYLICTHANELENGGYYHNTLELARFPRSDPACNDEKAEKFYHQCLQLIQSTKPRL